MSIRKRSAALIVLTVILLLFVLYKKPGSRGVLARPDQDETGGPAVSLDASQIDWLEISPSMGATMYVDDGIFIEAVTSLINGLQATQVAPSEAARIKSSEPGEALINGNTYSRSIRVEFVQKRLEDTLSVEILESVLLLGNYLIVSDKYYEALGITDAFLLLLDNIYSQGKGKTAIQVLPDKQQLTMDVIRDLANGKITASDVIKSYEGKDVTSGIYSFYSEIPPEYALLIGYTDIKNPCYVRLINTKTEETIDLTPDALESFLGAGLSLLN